MVVAPAVLPLEVWATEPVESSEPPQAAISAAMDRARAPATTRFIIFFIWILLLSKQHPSFSVKRLTYFCKKKAPERKDRRGAVNPSCSAFLPLICRFRFSLEHVLIIKLKRKMSTGGHKFHCNIQTGHHSFVRYHQPPCSLSPSGQTKRLRKASSSSFEAPSPSRYSSAEPYSFSRKARSMRMLCTLEPEMSVVRPSR